MKYFSACDAIIELVAKTENPEFIYDTLLSEMTFKQSNMDIETPEAKNKE